MYGSASSNVEQQSRFVVGIDAATKLPVFPFPGHLTIKKRKYAAADVVSLTVWVKSKVNDVGLEVILEVERATRSKTMQQ